jgi:hypothetical protein
MEALAVPNDGKNVENNRRVEAMRCLSSLFFVTADELQAEKERL